ncbi:MAG: BlaI/MecI/CopY family transcriptional regulator [Planctomycetes bacterium]|nr:BlaI/MecI/CopY family transcriptional regulator [Planctomycetota bacterium]
MGKRRQPVSGTELEVLKILWDRGPGTVREIRDALARRGRDLAYTTVLTLLGRLKAKGYARSDTGDFAHVFHAAVSREKLLGQRLRDLADQLCGGTATPLVLALVKEHSFSPGEIEEFRRLLDRLDEEKGKGPARRSR